MAGRVLRHDGRSLVVGRDDGIARVQRRATTPSLATGDWVLIDDDVVHDVLHRQSLLQRLDPSGGDQLIAANIDVVAVVCGLDRPVRAGRIERFAMLAWDAGAVPLIVLSKLDLVSDVDDAVDIATAASPGSDVVAVSAHRAHTIDELRVLLADRTVVVVGESGAGKSSLLNALAGRNLAETALVRAGDHKGRHTTTARELHVLRGRVRVIDTPGVRAVGLWANVATVDAVYDDVTELARGCRFNDCAHVTEPGCAVRAAVESGDLPTDRLASWNKLRREAASAELRGDPHAWHQANRRFARMVKDAARRKRA